MTEGRATRRRGGPLQWAAKRGVNWYVWSVAVNPAITDSYHTIKTKWTFTDLLDAHIALEAMRDIKAENGRG